ncbi:MAG: hypothetical protein AAF662_11445 [Pseudomonadota bacterium]
MSAVGDAIASIKQVLLLTEKVDRVAKELESAALELRDHDRRLVRIETMIEVGLAQRGLNDDRP